MNSSPELLNSPPAKKHVLPRGSISSGEQRQSFQKVERKGAPHSGPEEVGGGVTFFKQPLKSCLSANGLRDMAEDKGGDDDDSTLSSRSPPSRNSNNNGIKRSVSFGHVRIREHPRALGDNPSVSSGPALSLGWYSDDPGACEHSRTRELPLDVYEDGRPSRRGRRELVVPRHVRERVLQQEAGVSLSDMYAAEREAAKVKQSRRLSSRQSTKDPSLSLSSGVKLLESIAKLFNKKQGKRNSAEQKQLDELMDRAAAAERIRKKQQRQLAYREEELRRRHHEESIVQLSALPHSASEPFFLSQVPDVVSVSSGNLSDDEPLEF
jgi:hypothetical protein